VRKDKPVPIDKDKYRQDLKSLNLTKEEEDQVLDHLWAVMESFVSAAFGSNPTKQAVDEKQENATAQPLNVIDYE